MIIKDEIHGLVEFNEIEQKIIDSEKFQRLRRIKQLSTSYLVYPGANHTRYEHCLGTCYLAGIMAKQIGCDKEEIEKARLYGLLHDIGHTPFSHDGEEILKEYIGNHEKLGEEIIKNSEIADIISEKYKVEEIINFKKKALVESDLGADRIDYLQRDARNTGVAYGIIDFDRIVHKLKWQDNKLILDKRGLEAAEYLIIARFMMFSTVYLHKTVRIATAMLQKAIRKALEQGVDGKEFAALDDETAAIKLEEYNGSQEYIRRIKNRQLYKAIWIGKEENPEILERLKGKEYVIDRPQKKFKPVNIEIETEEGLKPIYTISPLIKALRETEMKRATTIIAAPQEQLH